jgi:hypothetical protein
MVIHIALYKWKSGVRDAEIDAALGEVRALKEKVEGLKHVFCGRNYSKWAEGYTHAIVVIAESQRALDAYRMHPDHGTVAGKIEAMEGSGIGVDFED